jgi:hypothetical protein
LAGKYLGFSTQEQQASGAREEKDAGGALLL